MQLCNNSFQRNVNEDIENVLLEWIIDDSNNFNKKRYRFKRREKLPYHDNNDDDGNDDNFTSYNA